MLYGSPKQATRCICIDAVPRLVAEAQRRSTAAARPLASCRIGDARDLDLPDDTADVVLLLGPLYHLTDSRDRARALREASRVLKPGGWLFAAAISRWASALDGLARELLGDSRFAQIVERDLEEGQHLNPTDRLDYFTTAYFHRPEELADEVRNAGLDLKGVYGLEGPGWILPDVGERMADAIGARCCLTWLENWRPSLRCWAAAPICWLWRNGRPNHDLGADSREWGLRCETISTHCLQDCRSPLTMGPRRISRGGNYRRSRLSRRRDGWCSLDALGAGWTVLYCYPRTGRPEESAPPLWDSIPGARGCTPQSCSYRDHHAELRAFGAHVYGVSIQTSAYQQEMVERLHLPFEVLSDAEFRLTEALRLPTFEAGGMRLLKRLTLLVRANRIERCLYPVFPPDADAGRVLTWLGEHRFD